MEVFIDYFHLPVRYYRMHIVVSPSTPQDVFTHTYVHTHMHVPTHTHTYTHTYIHTNTMFYRRLYMHYSFASTVHKLCINK